MYSSSHKVHSPQSLRTQSLLSSQCPTSHSAVSRRFSWHVVPPWWASSSMYRIRVRRPLPHFSLQLVHSCQSPTWQLVSAGPPQGLVSSKAPSQLAPPSSGYSAMLLVLMDWSFLSLHSVQAPHAPNLQSLPLGLQFSGTSKLAVSVKVPSQGVPQWLCCTSTSRCRSWSPVQPPWSCQGLQGPRMQSLRTHGPHFSSSGQLSHCSWYPSQTCSRGT
mmetsp:Transcript_130681/g.310017  ORF Transcript_130681/g.310017 Transcript_130681/m.310017 type:complete len:217 (+) Transcript_130681:182-832(+)